MLALYNRNVQVKHFGNNVEMRKLYRQTIRLERQWQSMEAMAIKRNERTRKNDWIFKEEVICFGNDMEIEQIIYAKKEFQSQFN